MIGVSTTICRICWREPARKDLSKYGFRWYIYNGDYSKYIQVGIKDNKVVGIYTNASNWKSNKGIMIGTSKEEVNGKYSNPLSGIRKGNTTYNLDNSQGDTYLIDDYYTTIFYDIHNGNTVTSVLLIEKETEEALNSFFGKHSQDMADRNYFSHTNPDGKSPFTRMEENNLEFMMAAENIAAGHRKNILGLYIFIDWKYYIRYCTL